MTPNTGEYSVETCPDCGRLKPCAYVNECHCAEAIAASTPPTSEDDRARAIPNEGQVVFVAGGVAQYRGGAFYSGMESPRWERRIQWPVEWWYPISADPAIAIRAPLVEEIERLKADLADEIRNAAYEAEECQKAKAEIERLKDAKDRLYRDALIGHRWFEKHFGESFNGRDFAIKCPMADAEIARLTRELAEAREDSARLILALEKQRCSCPVLLMCPHCGGNVTEGEDQYAGSWICGACVRTVSLPKDHSRPCLRCSAIDEARKERG